MNNNNISSKGLTFWKKTASVIGIFVGLCVLYTLVLLIWFFYSPKTAQVAKAENYTPADTSRWVRMVQSDDVYFFGNRPSDCISWNPLSYTELKVAFNLIRMIGHDGIEKWSMNGFTFFSPRKAQSEESGYMIIPHSERVRKGDNLSFYLQNGDTVCLAAVSDSYFHLMDKKQRRRVLYSINAEQIGRMISSPVVRMRIESEGAGLDLPVRPRATEQLAERYNLLIQSE